MSKGALDFLLDAEAELDSKVIEIRVSMVQIIAAGVLVLGIVLGSLGTLYVRVMTLEARVLILEKEYRLHEDATEGSEAQPPAGVPVGRDAELGGGLGA